MEIIEFQTDWSPSHFLAFWALTKETNDKKIKKIKNGQIKLKKGMPKTMLIVVVGESNTQIKRMITNEIFEATTKDFPYAYNQLIILEGLESDIEYPIHNFPEKIVGKFLEYINKNPETPEHNKLEHYSNFKKQFSPTIYICLKPIWELMETNLDIESAKNATMYLYGGDNMDKIVKKYGLDHVKNRLNMFKEIHWVETEHLFGEKSVHINPEKAECIFNKCKEIENCCKLNRKGKKMITIMRYLMKNWNMYQCKNEGQFKLQNFIDSSFTSEGGSLLYIKTLHFKSIDLINDLNFKTVELKNYSNNRPIFKKNEESNIRIVVNGIGRQSTKIKRERQENFIKYLESVINI